LSGLIQNRLDAIDIDDKRECCAWLTPNGKGVVFSFPTIDTSFVYFPATGDWAEWTPFAFKDVTRFSTEYNRGIRPSSLVLGILDAADSMFRYGNVATDTGHAIHAQYRTGPIGVSADYWKILKYGLWKQSNDSDSIMVRFYDEDNAQVYIHDDSTQYRYRKIAANPTASRYFKIDIQTYADSLAIQGLDLWPQFEGKAKEH